MRQATWMLLILAACGQATVLERSATTTGAGALASLPAATEAPAATPAPAAAADPNVPPAAPACAFALCEDFEADRVGGPPDSNTWAVLLDAKTDTLAISTAQVQQGNHALQIHVANGSGKQAMIVNKSAFPFPQDMFWGRAYVWFGSALPTNHTTYVAAGPNPNPYEWIRYSTFGGNIGGNDSGPDNSANTNVAMPVKAWACLEWQFDGPGQQAHYFLDGKALTTLEIEKKGNSANIKFAQVELGFELYQQSGNAPGWDMYLDNIALDASRVGCPP